MDARDRWEALQSSLREARTALASGDRVRALDAVDAALTLDPQFLAAQSLRARLLANSEMPSPAVVGGDEGFTARPVVSEGYVRFEERAKSRRVQRRLEAAREAVAHSNFDQAADAVAELRQLDPTLDDLPALSNAIARGRTSRHPARGSRAIAAAVIAVIVLTATTLVVRRMQMPDLAFVAGGTGESAPPPRVVPQEPAPVQTPIVSPSAIESEPPSPMRQAGDGEGRVTPTIAIQPSAPSETVERVLPSPQTLRPEVRTGAAPFTPPAVAVRSETGGALPSSSVSSSPVTSGPASPIHSASADPVSPAAAPAPAAPVVPVGPVIPVNNDEQLVHQALQRYRWAYGELDAASAHAVWPAVDQAALARAFDGLASQALTFEACNVELAGTRATAACSGTARYVPKVGSREPRVEARRWNFSLRKVGADWQIENARAEQ